MWTRVVVSIVLVASPAAHAGTARATQPVNLVAAPAQYPDDLPGPPLELAADAPPVALPAVPAFGLPGNEPGFHGPRELAVRGRALLGKDLKVRGYVTWVYDCAGELARANRHPTRAEIDESIERDPGLCDAPMFSLGDARTTARDASIWVVDLPDARAGHLAVGDPVVVTGRWALESPRGARNAAGLLIYRAAERTAPPPAFAEVAAPTGLPDVDVTTDVPLRTIIDTAIRNASVAQLNTCNRAIAARKYDDAIAACQRATELWSDNHLAWYGRASALLGRRDWPAAIAAIDRAVALRPDQAMYQLYAGLARYEAARARATPVGDARDPVLRAVKLAPELWRARYYLGRIFRDLDEPRRAAEQLSRAIELHPGFAPAYVALAELYRRCGYLDAALAVATLATARVPTGDAWFELAMVHAARRADADAIATLGKALAVRPDDLAALLQRGQLHLRRNDSASARKDLERVVQSTDPRAVVARRLASQLLAQLATRERRAAGRPRYKQIYRPDADVYKPWNLEDQRLREL